MKKIIKTLCVILFIAISSLSVKGQMNSPGFWAGDFQDDCLINGIDAYFILDVTGSMGPTLANMKAEISTYVNAIVARSNNNYRLGLSAVTGPNPYFNYTEMLNSNNQSAFQTALNSLTASGGSGLAPWAYAAVESIEVVPPDGKSLWASNKEKILFIITDAENSGGPTTGAWVDILVSIVDVNEANVKIVAIQTRDIDGNFNTPATVSLQSVTNATGGIFVQTTGNPSNDILAAIENICTNY